MFFDGRDPLLRSDWHWNGAGFCGAVLKGGGWAWSCPERKELVDWSGGPIEPVDQIDLGHGEIDWRERQDKQRGAYACI